MKDAIVNIGYDAERYSKITRKFLGKFGVSERLNRFD